MSDPVYCPRGISYEESTAIVDSLYRAVIGLDSNDQPLFDSAWLDQPDVAFVNNGAPTTGLPAIRDGVFNRVGPLDTTHLISNVRITRIADDRKSATFSTYALAQHFRPGQGPALTSTDRKNILSGCRYFIDVVHDDKDGLWKMKKWAMQIIWLEGDFSVVMG